MEFVCYPPSTIRPGPEKDLGRRHAGCNRQRRGTSPWGLQSVQKDLPGVPPEGLRCNTCPSCTVSEFREHSIIQAFDLRVHAAAGLGGTLNDSATESYAHIPLSAAIL